MNGETIYLKYSHDDVFELYLNGEKLVATDYSWNNDVLLELSDAAKKKLQKGKNVLAAHCHNTTGGAYVDFGLYRLNKQTTGFETAAVQKSVSVLPHTNLLHVYLRSGGTGPGVYRTFDDGRPRFVVYSR